MQVPVDEIRELAERLFEDREATTRNELMKAAAERGMDEATLSALAQLPPGAFTHDELLGEIRSLAERYAEPVPTRTSDFG